ncbi:putative transmembrane protein [Toxoplasma gondii GAB2-2007-GAL-DOM2]|uniref:Transmembrane protein n=5 Tax=Toxoplasma gondii TaxID=5811 RepID=S7WHB6_TOXGG|nr:hypothetical protein TGGT1_247970 [Toxoplasma gondii GT1]KAF4638588.1 hypothetical protein TGRH88_061960 [Toxoplasma gondii]KFG46696.1 putative transmembrane protein [Toxoplasma gondii GAB2-2007-GAL-DOM2]KFG54057.1 putative transmembrane protein [Toxoplasma gondii FOU]RQX72083.1 putative transmembrane protein [Toxoplasma gondii CAST]
MKGKKPLWRCRISLHERDCGFVHPVTVLSFLVGFLLWTTTLLAADCYLTIEHGTLPLGENLSRGKVKVPLTLGKYEAALTYTGYAAFERFAFVPLTKEKFAVMYNWCPEQDRHSNAYSGTEPLFFSCRVRVEFFTYNGERAEQEYYVGGTLHSRSSFTYNPDKYPELKALGFWVHGPHEGKNSNKVVIAFWTARCKTPQEARVCTGSSPCTVNLRKSGSSGATSCLAELYGADSVTVPLGERICSGDTPWAHGPADCYQYELANLAPSGLSGGADGWQTDPSSSGHGYRLGSPTGVAQHGGRYGSVYIVRIPPGDAQEPEWETLVATDVSLEYGHGLANGLWADKGEGTATEARYAVTFYTHQWSLVDGKPVLWPQCLTQLIADDGSVLRSNGLLNRNCSSCSSPPLSRVHPKTRKWVSVCTSDKPDAAGVFINDVLAVDSTAALDGKAQHTLGTSLAVDSSAQILPASGAQGDWLLFWRRAFSQEANGGKPDPLLGQIQMASLMMGRWSADGRNPLAAVKEIDAEKSVLDYSELRVSALGPQDGVLVGYGSALRWTTTLVDIFEDGNVDESTPLTIQRIIGNVLNNAAFATDWLPLPDGSVFWVTRFSRGNDSAGHETIWPNTAAPATKLQFVRVHKVTDDPTCIVKWNQKDACNSTCHRHEVLQNFVPKEGTSCSLNAGVSRTPTCREGACQRLKLSRVYEGAETAQVSSNGKQNAAHVSDSDLATFVRFEARPSAFTVELMDASDVWEVSLAFLVKPEEWGTGIRFTCVAYDRQRNAVASREGLLGRIPPANVLETLEGWAVALWSWQHIRLFGVQTLECSAHASSADRELVLAEAEFIGKVSGLCPPEGFFGRSECPSEEARLVFDVAALDCQGTWSEWSLCDANCLSSRLFTRTREAQWGGKPCEMIQRKPCGEGPFCPSSTDSETRRPLLDLRRPCLFKESSWSACFHCRQLRRRQILREASGPGVDPCPEVVEMQFCSETCRLQYDFAHTASSTYAPITTLPARLFTVVPLTTTVAPLSWHRWFTLERLRIAAWLLVAALFLCFLGLCIFCSFRKNTQGTPEPVECSPGEEIPPPIPTFTSMKRRTTVKVQSAASAVAGIVAASKESRLPVVETTGNQERLTRKSWHSVVSVYGLPRASRKATRATFYTTRERGTTHELGTERRRGSEFSSPVDGKDEERETPLRSVHVRSDSGDLSQSSHVGPVPRYDGTKREHGPVQISELTHVRESG